MDLSPRNLLMIRPFYPLSLLLLQKHQRPEQLRKHTAPVDISDQKHRCIQQVLPSPCSRYHSLLRLISAGLPAPSITMISACSCKLSKCLQNVRNQFFLISKIVPGTSYSRALRHSRSPGIRCHWSALTGSDSYAPIGSIPAASACITCARPISSPSFVI